MRAFISGAEEYFIDQRYTEKDKRQKKTRFVVLSNFLYDGGMSLANATQFTHDDFAVPSGDGMTHHDAPDAARYVNPIAGYALLFGGILLMLISAFQVYRVFTKQAEPFQLFNFEGIKVNIAQMTPQIAETPELVKLQKQLGINLNQVTQQVTQPIEIFPAAMVNTLVDFGAYMMLMGFLVNLGAKLASIGVKLVRPVYIKA